MSLGPSNKLLHFFLSLNIEVRFNIGWILSNYFLFLRHGEIIFFFGFRPEIICRNSEFHFRNCLHLVWFLPKNLDTSGLVSQQASDVHFRGLDSASVVFSRFGTKLNL